MNLLKPQTAANYQPQTREAKAVELLGQKLSSFLPKGLSFPSMAEVVDRNAKLRQAISDWLDEVNKL